MRLTLRTLLAWLDDTLPPEEVREIGTQVSTTPFAQTLIERIRKVTRRRRLTVPSPSGPEGVDANVVAAYLDNELDAEKVAEYEKLCLSSDVNLAEVASAHQILSLIKNKAKVPPEARYRMYRLFKGPEAVRTNYREVVSTAAGVVPGAFAKDADPPWAKPFPEQSTAFERFAPWLVAIALTVVLGVIGYLNLRYADVQIREADSLLVAQLDSAAPEAEEEANVLPEPDVPPRHPVPLPGPGLDDQEEFADINARLGSEAGTESEAQPEPEPEPAAPRLEGIPAVVKTTDGVVLRTVRSGANRVWERLEAEDRLAPRDRVVNLAPFRTTLALGPIEVSMIAQSELRVSQPELADDVRFELIDGSVVLRSPNPDQAVTVGFESLDVSLRLPAGRPVGLSWMGLKAPGAPAGRPLLTILCPEGTVGVSADGDAEPQTFDGPILVSIDPEDGILGAEPAVMPRWVVDPEPQPADIQAGEAFGALFEQSTGSITFTLLEGTEDPDPTVRSLSVAALGAMTDADPEALEQVMAQLNRTGDPAVRATAIGVIMRRMGRGVESAEQVGSLLERFVDPPEAAEDLERLLLGIPEDKVGDEEVYAQLVEDLSSPSVAVRQLALDTLLMMTGREDHGYDPDSPGGSGLTYWQDLLKQGRLAPAARRGAAGPAPSPTPPRDRRQ